MARVNKRSSTQRFAVSLQSIPVYTCTKFSDHFVIYDELSHCGFSVKFSPDEHEGYTPTDILNQYEGSVDDLRFAFPTAEITGTL